MSTPGSAGVPPHQQAAGRKPAVPFAACGSTHTRSEGRNPAGPRRAGYSFHDCADCGLIFVERFAGFEIYDDAYYRAEGPDPFVDYESEYRDWRRTDRGLEFDDFARIAAGELRNQETPGNEKTRPATSASVL